MPESDPRSAYERIFAHVGEEPQLASAQTTKRAVLAARLDLLDRQATSGMMATFPALLVLTAVLWATTTHANLLIWLALAATVNSARLFLQQRFRRDRASSTADLENWSHRFELGAALAGFSNGGISWLLIGGSITEQVFLILIIGGLTAGALATLSPVYEVYRAYTGTALISPIGMSLAIGDSWFVSLAVLLVIYLGLMLRTARHLAYSLGRSLELRFQNLELVETLQKSGESQERTNRELAAEIEQRCEVEKALQQEKERAQVTVESIGDAVITADMSACIEYMNPMAVSLTGISSEEARGKTLDQVLDLLDEETGERFRCLDKAATDPFADAALPKEPVIRNPSTAKEHSVQITLSPIRDGRRQIVGSVLVLHDVTAVRQMARQMSYQATHDPLTGLVNRRALDTHLHEFLEEARHAASQHALMVLDLDRFKIVNDTCGHAAGDELLRQMAGLLTDELRSGDLVARLGGDEFAVLLRSCSAEEAQRMAGRLQKRIQEFRFAWDQYVFDVGVSVGLVPISQHSHSVAEVLNSADAACYLAKEGGRNHVHLALPGDEELARQRGDVRWIHRIKAALKENRFVLYCQNAVPIGGEENSPRYTEFLVRIRAADKTIVGPGRFIPVAERYQLMPKIDHWVLENALAHIATAPQTGSNRIFAVNVSGQSLGESTFLNHVLALLEKYRVYPGSLCFEITETAAIANFQNASIFVERMRSLGCHFALDDFGNGLSSFAYLRSLKVDFLKIDGEFVRDIANDAVNRAMVSAITRLGHVMGHRIVAECVESDAVKKVLASLGVDYAQGFAIHRPEPLGSLIQEEPPSLETWDRSPPNFLN